MTDTQSLLREMAASKVLGDSRMGVSVADALIDAADALDAKDALLAQAMEALDLMLTDWPTPSVDVDNARRARKVLAAIREAKP